jgi:hypothetical protein
VTAQLAQLYKDAGADRKFEVILVSYDDDDKALEGYMKKSKMEWPALKVSENEAMAKLLKLGDTGFIPNAVAVSPDGKMLTNDLKDVQAKMAGGKKAKKSE